MTVYGSGGLGFCPQDDGTVEVDWVEPIRGQRDEQTAGAHGISCARIGQRSLKRCLHLAYDVLVDPMTCVVGQGAGFENELIDDPASLWRQRAKLFTGATLLGLAQRCIQVVQLAELIGALPCKHVDKPRARPRAPPSLDQPRGVRLSLATCLVYLPIPGLGELLWNQRIETIGDRKQCHFILRHVSTRPFRPSETSRALAHTRLSKAPTAFHIDVMG